jgi:aspartate aminotransferase-like enzyme
MVEEEFLATPGPTEIPLRVLRALMKPAVGPGDPEFMKTMDETSELLQELLQTKSNVFFFPGSGRVSIESAILSVVEPGDKVLAAVNGVFGKWMRQTAERAGAQVIEITSDWRKAIAPSQVAEVLDRERDVKLVMIVHNETSTGLRNPIREIGKIVRKSGSTFLVDTVSSLGGDDVRSDEWGIDLNCTGCYKCINSPPGLSIVSVSEKAWEVMEKRSRPAATFSYDLLKWRQMWLPRSKGGKEIWGYRRHPIEPAPHLTYALNEALKLIIEEGMKKRFAMNRMAGEAIRSGCKAMGVELYPLSEDYVSNTLTGIVNPEGVDSAEILELMRGRYGVVAGGGLEETAGKILRVAHMSMTSREMYVTRSIFALGSALRAVGRHVDPNLGVEAARKVFADHPRL